MDSIMTHLPDQPGILLLQDSRLRPNQFAKAKASLQRAAPDYHCWLHSKGERSWDWKKHKRRRHWTGVATLIHKKLLPSLNPVQLRDMGITGDAMRVTEGRLLINRIPGAGGDGYVINAYQHVSGNVNHARWLLQVSNVMEKLKKMGSWVVLGGDWNASLTPWRGYLTKVWSDDVALKEWTRLHGVTVFPGDGHTWSNQRGLVAQLDYVMGWAATGQQVWAEVLSSHQLSSHPSHDHLSISTSLPPTIVQAPSPP